MDLKERSPSKTSSASGENSEKAKNVNEDERHEGLTVSLAAFFMVAQMAGAGFLALPRAMADAGWLGFVMILTFCGSIGFAATRLGRSWVILERRWPKYRQRTRQPYLDIAFEALGPTGRKLAMFCMMVTLIGSTIVLMSLIAELTNSLLPKLSLCEWACVAALVITPVAWLGTPNDFWQASVFAVVSTIIAIIIIIVMIIIDYSGEGLDNVPHIHPNVAAFSSGFGAILFAFGGASVFPTIQNDMKERSQFWKSVIVSFATILLLYVPVALSGFLLIGEDVDSNIILSIKPGPVVTVATILQLFNLLGTFIISLSPVVLSLEQSFSIPNKFGVKRILMRSLLIMFELLVVLAIPDFSLILNLIGGSTTCCLSFVFPPLMYIRLMDDQSDDKWVAGAIPLWQRIFLWEIIVVGAIGGAASTVSAFFAIFDPDSFSDSCFATFQVAA